jgi:N-acetylmuramoyl-L-alanine amidase
MGYVNDHRLVGANPVTEVAMTPIMGVAEGSEAQALAWAGDRGAHQRFLDVIPVYYELAANLGVRADVAVAQSGKETRYGQYGGVVPPEFHNWCGLKTTSGGSNKDPNAHARFPSDRVGVQAHLEHLFLYAVRQVQNPVDPRHFASIAGVAPSVELLGGHWAPSATYGESIVNGYLKPLLGAEAAPEPPSGWSDWAEPARLWASQEGLLTVDSLPKDLVTLERLMVFLHRYDSGKVE